MHTAHFNQVISTGPRFETIDGAEHWTQLGPVDFGAVDFAPLVASIALHHPVSLPKNNYLEAKRYRDIPGVGPLIFTAEDNAGWAEPVVEAAQAAGTQLQKLAEPLLADYKLSYCKFNIEDEQKGNGANIIPHLDNKDTMLVMVAAYPRNTQHLRDGFSFPASSASELVDTNNNLTLDMQALITVDDWTTIEGHVFAFNAQNNVHRKRPHRYTFNGRGYRAVSRMGFVLKPVFNTKLEQL